MRGFTTGICLIAASVLCGYLFCWTTTFHKPEWWAPLTCMVAGIGGFILFVIGIFVTILYIDEAF